jgi:hypothetical protein
MTVRSKKLLAQLKEDCTECEICGFSCEFINYPCRDSDGIMAEVTSVCRKCHDKWSLCSCRKKGDKA